MTNSNNIFNFEKPGNVDAAKPKSQKSKHQITFFQIKPNTEEWFKLEQKRLVDKIQKIDRALSTLETEKTNSTHKHRKFVENREYLEKLLKDPKKCCDPNDLAQLRNDIADSKFREQLKLNRIDDINKETTRMNVIRKDCVTELEKTNASIVFMNKLKEQEMARAGTSTPYHLIVIPAATSQPQTQISAGTEQPALHSLPQYTTVKSSR